MDVATATHTKHEALPPGEDGANAQSRIAHTLTACCRCRTVSVVKTRGGEREDEMRERRWERERYRGRRNTEE